MDIYAGIQASGIGFAEVWHWSSLLAIPMIGFLSAMLGSYTGLGGGMITRPLAGIYMSIPGTAGLGGSSLVTVLGKAAGDATSIMSNAGVVANSLVAVPKYMKYGVSINWKIITWTSIGLLMGQLLIGNQVYYLLTNGTVFGQSVGAGMEMGSVYIDLAYALFLIIVFFIVWYKDKIKPIKGTKDSIAAMIGVGMFIGTVAGLFGVSGGAIKIPFLIIFFGLSIKEAAVYSLTLALVSAPVKIATSYIHIAGIDNTALTVASDVASLQWATYAGALMMPTAIAGSFIGVKLNNKSKEKTVKLTLAITLGFFAIHGIVNAAFTMGTGSTIMESVFPPDPGVFESVVANIGTGYTPTILTI